MNPHAMKSDTNTTDTAASAARGTRPDAAAPANILEVDHLSTDFVMNKGTVHAVIDMSFTVREGEVLAIVGESGSGKSVTSLSVMGLLQSPGCLPGAQRGNGARSLQGVRGARGPGELHRREGR